MTFAIGGKQYVAIVSGPSPASRAFAVFPPSTDSSDGRATVEWWAVVSYERREQTLGGVSVLRFAPDGLVVEQRDYWAAEDGRRDPPPGWS